MKQVSVIISAYSIVRLRYVLSCIKSLKKQSLLLREIILVLDPDQRLIEFYKSQIRDDVKIIVSEGYGVSKARNFGIKNAEGEIVAFIDDDAIADKEWLENLVKNYDDPYVVGVGGLIKPVWKSSRPIWFPEELDWIIGCSYKGLPRRKTRVRNLIGCNMSFRKNLFEKVGYFRTDIGRLGRKLLAGEETELFIRIAKRIPKSKNVYDPSVVVYHIIDDKKTKLSYLLKRSFYEGFSKALITKHILNPLKTLSTEDRYLRYLLKVTIPSRLKRIHKFESICHLMILITSICLVLIGYLVGLSNTK